MVKGGGSSKEDEKIAEERFLSDFWFSIVELVEPHVPAGVTMKWDPEQVQQRVLAISQFDASKHWDFRAASPYPLHQFEKKRLSYPLRIPTMLLKLDQRLGRLRFRLVPARISEEEFWQQYMEQLICTISEHILSSVGDDENEDEIGLL